MENTLIIILGIILILIILLNHITIVQTTTSPQATCSQTAFGCCPDGVNSKMNYYGTNCPGYRPSPGYYPVPPGPGPMPPKPIGGCILISFHRVCVSFIRR